MRSAWQDFTIDELKALKHALDHVASEGELERVAEDLCIELTAALDSRTAAHIPQICEMSGRMAIGHAIWNDWKIFRSFPENFQRSCRHYLSCLNSYSLQCHLRHESIDQ
jgi:hypothetical protein